MANLNLSVTKYLHENVIINLFKTYESELGHKLSKNKHFYLQSQLIH